MNSHLLKGKVVHRRSRPTSHNFEHDVWYIALDLDELDQVPRLIPLIRRNGRGLVSFHDSDYLPQRAKDLRADVRAILANEGLPDASGRITLVTSPRILGYQFNPASFYLCRDDGGSLTAVVIEVHNTFGDRHLYVVPRDSRLERPGHVSGAMNKTFFVSPFISVDGRYQVGVRDSADRLSIGINLRQGGQPLLATSLDLQKVPLTTGAMVRFLLRYPLMTQRTTALIHWHGLRLWLKRIPWHRHTTNAAAPRTVAAVHGGSK